MKLFEDFAKKIIQRKLSLTQKYLLVGCVYKALADGDASQCENCGKLISNIATVKGEEDNKSYHVGMDCLETFLINNKLLSGEDIEQFTKAKKSLPKVITIKKNIQEFLTNNKFIDKVTLQFKDDPRYTQFVEYEYWSGSKQKWNNCEKVKNFDFDLLMNTLKNMGMEGVRFVRVDNNGTQSLVKADVGE
jgi:hypothetical protein